ncbi:hypothetical protein ACBP89_13780, partial [Aneurinibacillus aneurinilyticus]|uniref:hypothetical protein n=1 Tax=Aneurinibacillus aneurinilyticus TaxID=1391 RepID=UPI003523B0AE
CRPVYTCCFGSYSWSNSSSPTETPWQINLHLSLFRHLYRKLGNMGYHKKFAIEIFRYSDCSNIYSLLFLLSNFSQYGL